MKKAVALLFLITLLFLPASAVRSLETAVQSAPGPATRPQETAAQAAPGPTEAPVNPTDEILAQVLRAAEDVQAPGFDFSGTVQGAAAGRLPWSLQGVLHTIGSLLLRDSKEQVGLVIKIVALGVLAGLLCSLRQGLADEGIAEISLLVCLAAIAGLAVTGLSGLAETAVTTIDSLTLFTQSLTPLWGALTLSGGQAALVGFYPALFLSMQSFIYLCKQLFLPLVTVITALTAVNAMTGRFHLSRLLEFMRQTVKWGIGLLLTVFIGVLSVQGFAAAFAGGVTGRTVKYALCNFIPLVGSVLAESTEAVVRSLQIIKGAVGLTGVLGLIALCGAPLLKILTASLLYRFAAGVAEPATDKRVVRLLTDLAESITLLFVIVLMVCIMFIISIALLCTLLP